MSEQTLEWYWLEEELIPVDEAETDRKPLRAPNRGRIFGLGMSLGIHAAVLMAVLPSGFDARPHLETIQCVTVDLVVVSVVGGGSPGMPPGHGGEGASAAVSPETRQAVAPSPPAASQTQPVETKAAIVPPPPDQSKVNVRKPQNSARSHTTKVVKRRKMAPMPQAAPDTPPPPGSGAGFDLFARGLCRRVAPGNFSHRVGRRRGPGGEQLNRSWEAGSRRWNRRRRRWRIGTRLFRWRWRRPRKGISSSPS
ncbi:MAG: hypothetical protein HQK57_10230 [Deltaproteobacteria bacterium]|nr:hypothetical protein [Deltaproteobacteria bacterium]